MKRLSWLAVIFSITILLMAGKAQSASLRDPFDGNKLQNPNWKWSAEPKSWDVSKTKAGWLHVKGELNRNLWADDTTNRLYQEQKGDFDVETHLFMEYKNACTVAGLVAYSPTTKDRKGRTGEWVTLKLWGRGPANGNNAVLQYQKREFDGGEGLTGTVAGFQEPAGPMDVYMRLNRKSDSFTSWFKRKKDDKWIQIGVTQHKFDEPMQVGLYIGICDAVGEQIAQFEYFEDLVAPFAVSSPQKLPTAWADIKKRSLQEGRSTTPTLRSRLAVKPRR